MIGALLTGGESWDRSCVGLYIIISSPREGECHFSLFSHTGTVISDWELDREYIIRDYLLWSRGGFSE